MRFASWAVNKITPVAFVSAIGVIPTQAVPHRAEPHQAKPYRALPYRAKPHHDRPQVDGDTAAGIEPARKPLPCVLPMPHRTAPHPTSPNLTLPGPT